MSGADIQNISITSTQTVSQPKPHTTYTIQIATAIRSWTVDRRYNDFVALNTELIASTSKQPPANLPPKHPWSLTRSAFDDKIIRERRVLLEAYLRSILTHKDPIWRNSYTFLDFLSVPQHTSNRKGSAGQYGDNIHWTPSNWLSEHGKVESMIRSIRAELLKRDALAGMGDAVGSRQSSVNAKKMIREAGEKIDVLGRGLESIEKAIGDGEKKRRGEMVDALRNERGDLARMAEAGVRTNREAMGGSGGTAFSRGGVGATGGSGGIGGTMPGGSSSLWGNGGSQISTGRVFGKKPEETEETRPLDDRGLLQLQQQKMNGQDQQLTELSKILQRQRGMGEEIHREIGEQTSMLEEIEHGVDKVGGKMARAKRDMNKLK